MTPFLPDVLPVLKPHEEATFCADGCGAYLVTLKDHGPRLWTCPACDLKRYDDYMNSLALTHHAQETNR